MRINKRQKPGFIFIASLLLLLGIELCLVSETSFADIFNVYNDSGVPHESQLWTSYPDAGDEDDFNEIQDQEAPERVSYFETVSREWASWGVFFDSEDGGEPYTLDLSGYSEGSLELFVRTPVDLRIEIRERNPHGRVYREYISDHDWDGEDEWQEISIPIEEFGANLTRIYSPFMITAEREATFSVDYVRWSAAITDYEPTPVEIDGRRILVDGDIFEVKGVAAEFTPVGEYGPWYDWSLYPENYTIDIPLIRRMGANAIRTYNQRPTQKEALDSFYERGIYVIMGFAVDAVYGDNEVVDFENAVVRENITRCFLDMVEHWKDHPAILMWCFGNEVNRVLEENDVDPSHWYSLVDECAERAHELEGEDFHPVTTANGDQRDWDIGDRGMNADDDSLPHLDLWSLQIYQGRSFDNAFEDYEELSAKPLLMSEFGCDAYDGRRNREDESMQREYLESQWLEISENLSSIDQDNVCLGGVIFSWRDGWYKSSRGEYSDHDTQSDWRNGAYEDPNMNEEWWGIVGISEDPEERILREAYDAIANLWYPFIDIPLRIGWSMFSFNVVPRDMSMMSILQPLMEQDLLIIAKDGEGNFIAKVDDEWRDTGIGDMDITKGYQILVNRSTHLRVVGSEVELPLEIPLSRGWTLIGYPDKVERDIRDVLRPLIDDGIQFLVKDEMGNFSYNRWDFWGMDTFRPGEGYYINVSEDTSLVIPPPEERRLPPQPRVPSSSIHPLYF